MNAVEIEAAISDLALQPFDAAEFPFAFLAAFGNKDTTLKGLRSGGKDRIPARRTANQPDIEQIERELTGSNTSTTDRGKRQSA